AAEPLPRDSDMSTQGTSDRKLRQARATAPDRKPDAKAVYFFGDGKAEGTREMKTVLGGKGANLAEMTNLGVPVPPGFTIACSACIDFLKDGSPPDGLREE